MSKEPFFSIIIPVYNGGQPFLQCLQAIHRSNFTDWELIVVDDGSTDGSGLLAGQLGARVVSNPAGCGPAAARNRGAGLARGRYLFFTDADCALHPDTLTRAARTFRADPGLAALFGSYDDRPAASNFIAQYKNLFHHHVHQTSQENASTFWTGCGAIARSVFLELGGFAANRYRRPAIEDIDLGYRLKQAGERIRLVKQLQVKHLKAWSLFGLLKSDILDRGIPWTRLILRHRVFKTDLNLQTHNRVSVVATYGLLLALGTAYLRPGFLLLAVGLAALLLWLNFRLYHFFYQKRGLLFTLKAIPMHWLYYGYNGLAFACGLWLHWQEQLRARLQPAGRKTLADDGP